MTRSAPSDRASSTCRVLQTAVTSASKCRASWTPAVPIAPDAPKTRIRWPFRRSPWRRHHSALRAAVGDRGGSLEGHRVGHRRDGRGLRHTDELGVGAEAEPGRPKDPVAWPERLYGRRGFFFFFFSPPTSAPVGTLYGTSDGFDGPGELTAQDRLSRPANSRDRATEQRHGDATPPIRVARRTVSPGDRRRVDAHEDRVVAGRGVVDLRQPQDLRRSVSVIDHGPHREHPKLRR